jgi:hypothetical protein
MIAGVNTLEELSAKLTLNVLLIKDKVASGTTVEDAETLARYNRPAAGTVGYRDFVALSGRRPQRRVWLGEVV